MRILLIEQEPLLSASLNTLLTAKGFLVEIALTGKAGEEQIKMGMYDLLIADLDAFARNGYEVIRRVRGSRSMLPIVLLSDQTGVDNRVEGLLAGADYVLSKPIDVRELLACIRNLLRRQAQQEDVMSMGQTELVLSSSLLRCRGKSVRLSAKENDLMRMLLSYGKRILSKETILGQIWGIQCNARENHVEVYIGFLRKKLMTIDADVRIVVSRRMGYHLERVDEEPKEK